MSNPVLIIGAGPVGMTMGSELARFGIPVRIIDKAAQRTDKSKALVLWSRTLELLDRGDGGADPFVQAGFKALAVNFIAHDKLVGRITMEGIQSPYNYGLMIPQSETERLLDERLNRLGVTVERQVELISFESSSSGVEAILQHADGKQETVSTDWLLGCDGAHSAVRHGLNAPFAGETMNSDWMLADVYMTGYPVPESEASIYWHRDGVFVVFPISPGRFRVLADLPATSEKLPPTPTLQEVQSIIDRRGPSGMVAFDPIWLAGFRINGRKVSEYRWGRVFLSGDAAHVHSPAGGQGMNTGMQDAFNLAWKLAMVIRKEAAESILDTYSPERSGVGDEVLKNAARLTTIGTMKNPIGQSIRNVVGHVMLGLSPVRHAVADQMSEITIGYSKSPLNGASIVGQAPKAGERVRLGAGEVSVGSGKSPRFALFGDKSDATSGLIRRFPSLLDSEIRKPLSEGGLWLVRPDGYVACASIEPSDIAAYLEAITA